MKISGKRTAIQSGDARREFRNHCLSFRSSQAVSTLWWKDQSGTISDSRGQIQGRCDGCYRD